jgi:hypothetical protein
MPFQCEICWIRNLEDRDPTPEDINFVRDIRRANLDAMSGKAVSTIEGHVRRTKKIVANSVRNNKSPSLQPRGPFPLADPMGMGLAVDILQESLVAVGRNEPTVQAETLRQLRGTFTKNWESSPEGVMEVASFGRGTGRVRPTTCPTQSEWFQDYWRGVESRMGHKSKANHALPMSALVQAINFIKEEAEAKPTSAEANYLWKVGAYLTFCTAGSLRGNEGFFMDVSGVRQFADVGKDGTMPTKLKTTTILSEEVCMNLPHVVLSLLGKFKGELGINHHILNVASETMTGLEPRWWMNKLVEVLQSENRWEGPAFATADGDLANPADYDSTFRYFLHRVQDEMPKLLPKKYDVDTMFGINRTPRKTANTRIKRAGLGFQTDEMNRWRKVEAAGLRRVRQRMNALYSEAVLLMPVTWRVSYAL